MSGAAERIDLKWSPPGPVAARFMASRAKVQIINGPIGSGKTTAAMMKAIRLGQQQTPSRRYRARNGKGELVPVRRIKVTAVRDTYRQLWRSTLPTWFRRVPKDVGSFTGAENAPAAHRISFDPGDGTIVDFHADFIAIGDQNVEDVTRGYEPTLWYLNELDLLPRELLGHALGRVGRFPEVEDGGASFSGVLADCNAPEFESWLYQDVFTKTPAELAALGAELFVQPGGREPGAENLRNLEADYYTPKIGQAAWYIARMLDNKPGFSRSGKPIYPEFNDRLHVAPAELEPVAGLPVGIGLDAGGSPAAIIGQRMPNGQRRITDELIAEHGTGPRRFGQALRQLLHDRYAFAMRATGLAGGRSMIRGWADPSAAYGADKQAGEEDWIAIVANEAGIRIDAAPTNDPSIRWEAVRRPLSSLIDGEPGLLLSPRCKVTRTGFNSGYRFRKMQVPGAERFDDKAEKNEFSHPHDGLQYWCLGDDGYLEVMDRKAHRGASLAAARQVEDWSPIR